MVRKISNVQVAIILAFAIGGSVLITGLVVLNIDTIPVETQVQDLPCGDELYLSGVNNISGGGYIVIGNETTGLLVFNILVSDTELADYIGLNSGEDLYLSNGTGKIFIQQSESFGCQKNTYLFYHLENRQWYVRLHPTDPDLFPWLLDAIIELTI